MGRKSSLMPCGLSEGAFDCIFNILLKAAEENNLIGRGLPYATPRDILDCVWGVYFHMYSTGRWNITVDYMSCKFGIGWQETSCRQKLTLCAHHIEKFVAPVLISWNADRLHHAHNTVGGSLEKEYKVCFDTVPVSVDDGPNRYNGKYQDSVVKLLVACTFTGLAVDFMVVSGTTADSVAQDAFNMEEKLTEHNVFAIADGGFRRTERVSIPYDKSKIWPKHRERDQSEEEYLDAAEKKLRYNEGLGFWRSRVEHYFSRVRWGRWGIFKNFISSDESLQCFVACSIAGINAEVLSKHGEAGCYGPCDEGKLAAVAGAIEAAKIGKSRYPRPEYIPSFEEHRQGRELQAARAPRYDPTGELEREAVVHPVAVPAAPDEGRAERAQAAHAALVMQLIHHVVPQIPQRQAAAVETVGPHRVDHAPALAVPAAPPPFIVTREAMDALRRNRDVSPDMLFHVLQTLTPALAGNYRILDRLPAGDSTLGEGIFPFLLPVLRGRHWYLITAKREEKRMKIRIFDTDPAYLREFRDKLVTELRKSLRERFDDRPNLREEAAAVENGGSSGVAVILTALYINQVNPPFIDTTTFIKYVKENLVKHDDAALRQSDEGV